ncbi:GGDEF domain-containing protein [Stappia sp. ES.058]|uniref:GGDEF domain-containing protein n=1 Tax=Stappia sp. ES.058 TaxID=1881061 RepID=UPI00087C0831|nr:GGDEF domain-containing protein [Stappia sp. ES.058]SDT92720.1 diguanylate cyclase/phosphodiesterase [Stappia sp. ES.058]
MSDDALMHEWHAQRTPELFLTQVEATLEHAFQPIVDIHSGVIYGFEALLRGNDALGFHTPCEVFDFAAENGCLGSAEAALQRKAIARFARFADAGKTKLFLNVDGRGLAPDTEPLVAMVNAVARNGLSPSNVCLEIPEIASRFDEADLHSFVQAARDEGFSFAIDDFGQGHSQLRLLYQYEPGILKIDRFFITALQNDARKRLFVSSVVDLAHVLGIRVVAEGVETPSELRACQDVGCDLVQGFLVARPFANPAEAKSVYSAIAELSQRKKARKPADLDFLDQEMEKLTPVFRTASIAEALEIFRANPTQTILPVVDEQNEPKGIIRESDLKSFLYMSYGRDLLLNPTIDNHLGRFIRPCAIADMHAPLDRLVDVGGSEPTDGIVITHAGCYKGCLLPNALLKLSNDARLRFAQEQNPLTKLPGNSAISDHVVRTCANADIDRAFIYIDFDNFKPFNDTYGFRIGDRALILFSELLKRQLDTLRAFVGHVGGDDYFVGLDEWQAERLAGLMTALRNDFAHQVESLYSAEHRTQGYIIANDRRGRAQTYPLLTCSIAVLHIPKGLSIENLDLLSNHIARLKLQAKSEAEGVAVASFGDADACDPSARDDEAHESRPHLTVV